MINKKNGLKAYIQIFLLIVGIFAFAYIIRETNFENKILLIEKKGINFNLLVLILKLGVKMLLNDKNFVSALEASDLSGGVATCVKGKDGSVCQEYPRSECDKKCEGSCSPATRNNVPECKLGTCYDSDSGICQERAPKSVCEANGGKWLDNIAGNLAECQKACCIVGEDVVPLITASECEKIEESSGINTDYKPEIRNELSCLALARTRVEGACIFLNENKCRFLTKGECTQNRGEFFEGILCTHPDLKMNYKKQASARCVEGIDEIYWFDSEGNRENIYDANKVKSWNGGRVLSKNESCSLGGDLKNQKTCGNCNRLFGSVCGAKTADEKLSDNSIDVVCRDLRCIDSKGDVRENGESWCGYQGAIGEEKGSGGFSRSVDTPGSAHFRATCNEGEIQINPCSDYRNEICIEERADRVDGKEISNSACIVNLWQLCLNYNTEIRADDRERTTEFRNKKCLENPHCILKKTDIADNFKFELCVPKYAPGFDLQKNPEGGELSCAFANQKCTVISVKGIGGWKVKVNEGCLKPRFAEQMNDLCMSLGDCGASVNYVGDLTENYKVLRSPKLNKGYLDGIRKYSETKEGQYAKVGDVTKYFNAIGGIEKLGGAFDPDYCKGLPGGDLTKTFCPGDLSAAGTIAGLIGTVLLFAPTLAEISSTASSVLGTVGITQGGALPTGIAGPAAPASLTAIGGALAGAAIGFAVTALLIQYTGIGAGLDPYMVWSLIAGGAVGGALLGTAYAASNTVLLSSLAQYAPLLGWIGFVLVIVVIIIIVIFVALGIGDTKKKIVEFQCLPWQPPLGGAKCGECGRDGYPCSKYACQSLGVGCRLINEGSNEEKCVNIGEGDISSPFITPWKEALSKGLRFEEVSDRGVKIISEEKDDGCIGAYENIFFGISLNEPGYCRYDVVSKSNFDEMEFDFGNRNLFLYNHSQFYSVPDLSSLGLPKYDPNVRADINLNIRCIDYNGNGKDSREYVINFCARPGIDKSSPKITMRQPGYEYAGYNIISLDAGVFTDEPATCRWSLNEKKYDEMENKFECENDIVDRESIFGWECKSKFPISKDDNIFYVKCKDQPWYGEDWEGEGSELIEKNESKRNEMTQSYEFIVKRTKTPLKIDSIKPNNETLIFGVQPATVILEVKTLGGVDDKATCKLSATEMAETFGSVHKQSFNQIYAGEYEFPIMCEDRAGNIASADSKFKVEIDVDAPIVTRVYSQGGSLIVITNENAECRFVRDKTESCNFNFANGSLMSGIERIHNVELDGGVYYVKCKDDFGNIPGECSVIVVGVEIRVKT